MNSKRQFLRLAGCAALTPLAAQARPERPTRLARPNSMANYFPNVELETHDGRKVRFYDDLIRGKLVAFNMMYSICTGICPANTANLKIVYDSLGARVGKDVFMYSITLRPEFDDAKALRDYRDSYDIQPGWIYLTCDASSASWAIPLNLMPTSTHTLAWYASGTTVWTAGPWLLPWARTDKSREPCSN
jgi:protein SCO1